MSKKALTINPANGKKVLKTFVDNEVNAKGKDDVAYSANAVDNIVKTISDTKADSTGNINNDFNAKNITISGNIIPNKTGLSIGSEEHRFSSIYVNEAYLSTNTLYLGDTPVMGTDSDTIMIKSDRDQSITMKTTGIGNSNIISEKGVELSTSGPNADVIVQAKGMGSRAVLSANNSVDVNSPYINMTGDTNINGPVRTKNLTVDGNIIINGETFTVNSTTVQTKDNIIEVNYGQIGDGVSAGKAGLKVNRGDSAPYYMIFDETDDMFKVGTVESLQTLATQTYVNNNRYVHPEKHNVSEITGLSTVATTGSYTDLLNKPTLYSNWSLKTNSGDTSQLNVTNSKLININGEGSTTVSRSGDTITISSANTIYSGGTAINVSDSTINHSNISRSNTTSTQQAINGGTITAIDSIVSNEQGHITGVNTKTITLPTSTDVNVTNVLNSNTKAYITGTTSSTTNTGTQVFDTNVFLDTTAGHLTATQFNGKLNGNANTASKLLAPVSINGTSFDGSGNITTTKWGTARTLTIDGAVNGNVSIDGGSNVTLNVDMNRTDLTGKTVDLNSYNMSSGQPSSLHFVEKTTGGCAGITNCPVLEPFLLDVYVIRWASTKDYITKQIFTSATTKAQYTRWCTNGVWTGWTNEARMTTSSITSGEVVISDGTTGGIKSSGFTIGKSVPSNAVFTDTWRGIQDNLTSTSTTESLSANQGKILKDLVDSKANTSHGNHVPTTQTANARVFLRNDNTWQTLPSATTSATGIVQLSDAVNSTSVSLAATANAVKKSYDLANSKTEIIASQTQPSGNITGRVWLEITG